MSVNLPYSSDDRDSKPTSSLFLFALTIFLSAFLLFQIEPMIGRYILPWYGGSPAVWAACVLFFQTSLLGGYCYAFVAAGRLPLRRQAAVHLCLLAVCILTLPITPSESWKPAASSSPTLRILGLLGAAIGLPFFLLASTGPLLQEWLRRLRPGYSPYRLFALSNLGSLLALLSYPFIVEPSLRLHTQTTMWSWGFGLAALGCGYCAWSVMRTAGPARFGSSETESPVTPRPGWTEKILWMSLSTVASAMMLAVTNQMCQDVAVVPFLWVLPLALYLLSFVICFDHTRWYLRSVFGILLAGACYLSHWILSAGVDASLREQVLSYSGIAFVCFMVCHGELARMKPAARHVTLYYLMIALGGALGGCFVTLAAPQLFRGFWEFQLALLCTCLLFLIVIYHDPHNLLHAGKPYWAWAILIGGFWVLLGSLVMMLDETLEHVVATSRNFYGVLRVKELDKDNPLRSRFSLLHGRIEHGFQYRSEERRNWPTSYYGLNSGLGMAIQQHPRREGLSPGSTPFTIGVVGLGTGTIASYGRAGDRVRFYEINPEVVRLSDAFFSYRKESPARIEVVVGDARISLAREMVQKQPQRFDVLAVDAFSSDAIPVHLLTLESFRLYWYHLKEDGILAMHVSSRYLKLGPVIWKLAAQFQDQGMRAVFVDSPGIDHQGTDGADWVLVTKNRQFLQAIGENSEIQTWADDVSSQSLWTDDYSNLFKVLKR